MKKLIETKLARFFEIGPNRTGSVHLSRKKFMLGFVAGLLLSKQVSFSAIAEHLNPEAEWSSNVRRIQRFFKDYQLDYLQIATLLICFLPAGRLSIAMDRTNWQVNGQNVNILTITAYCRGVGVPLFFELLDKKGISNTGERQALLRRLFRLLSPKQIAAFCADREFVGRRWYTFLMRHQIPFYIRIKGDTQIKLNGVLWQAQYLALPAVKRLYPRIEVYGLKLSLATKRIIYTSQKEDEVLLILTNARLKQALNIYRQRWSIEVFFQSIKSRGFQLESTQLNEIPKLKKLFAFICIAFACCLHIGIWKHQYHKPMRKKDNGYKPNSFFRYGLNEIRSALLRLDLKLKQLEGLINQMVKHVIDNLHNWTTFRFLLEL